jgi:hypothetical protein
MIVAPIEGIKILLDRFPGPEVKGGLLNRLYLSSGNQSLIYRYIGSGMEGNFVGENVPFPLSGKIKIAMISKVQGTKGVNLGLIISDQLIGLGKPITHHRFKISWKPLISVKTFKLKPDKDPIPLFVGIAFPEELIETSASPVEAMGSVVLAEDMLPPLKGKSGVPNTVGKPSYRNPQIRFIMGIPFQGRVPQEHILFPGFAGRHIQGGQRRPKG